MAQVFLIGTITTDLELRMSVKRVPYIRFGILEKTGYRETCGRQYYQVWAFGSDAEWLARKNVKKGSLFWISGQLRLVDCLEPDGATTSKMLKVTFKDGDYVGGINQQSIFAEGIPAAESAETISPKDGTFSKGRLDGDREPLPE